VYSCSRSSGHDWGLHLADRIDGVDRVEAGGGPTTTAVALLNPGPSPTAGTSPLTDVDLLVDGIRAPRAAGKVLDDCGDPVSFGARRMVDGDEATAWRMRGDGTGRTVVLELEGPRRVHSVGLVPGFDGYDACDGRERFPANRRITEVTWEFDDGTRIHQDLMNVASLQRIDVDATTTRVRLHIDGVTADPDQDYTAISELVVRGV
jgi:hypothetical protein